MLGQGLSCAFGTFIAGNDTRTSLRVGMGLAQIGEFSFIIAALGLSLKVTSEFLYPIAVAVSAITTLLNPYLIKSSDRFVNWFDRAAPLWFVNYLALYTQWLGRLGSQRHTSMATKLARRWFGQMALNAVLVAAFFGGAAFFAGHQPGWFKEFRLGTETVKAVLWLTAMIMALPLLIATFRKLQALGLLLAETRISKEIAGERTAAIRDLVAQSVPIAGLLVLIFYLLVLSSALLPPVKILIVLIGIVVLVTLMLRRTFIKVYSRAQFALRETLSQPPPPREAQTPAQLPGLLREADLETIQIAADSPAVGKLIRELELRTRTGTSIVGIERSQGQRIINPGPDEELQSGDQVLLLGTRPQLDSARAALSKPA